MPEVKKRRRLADRIEAGTSRRKVALVSGQRARLRRTQLRPRVAFGCGLLLGRVSLTRYFPHFTAPPLIRVEDDCQLTVVSTCPKCVRLKIGASPRRLLRETTNLQARKSTWPTRRDRRPNPSRWNLRIFV